VLGGKKKKSATIKKVTLSLSLGNLTQTGERDVHLLIGEQRGEKNEKGVSKKQL